MHVTTRLRGAGDADDFLLNGCMCGLPSDVVACIESTSIGRKHDRRCCYSSYVIRGIEIPIFAATD